MNQVNERSNARLTVSFFDFDDLPSAPTSASYTVFVRETGFELRGETALSAAEVIEIYLDKTDTQIVDSEKWTEAHSVRVTGVYAAGEVNAVFDFDVVNLATVSGVS